MMTNFYKICEKLPSGRKDFFSPKSRKIIWKFKIIVCFLFFFLLFSLKLAIHSVKNILELPHSRFNCLHYFYNFMKGKVKGRLYIIYLKMKTNFCLVCSGSFLQNFQRIRTIFHFNNMIIK